MLAEIVAELVVTGALVAGSLAFQGRFFRSRLRAMDDAEESRRVAAYKMAKANERANARTDKAARRLADQARQLHEDARLLHERVDTHMAHPAVKRLTNTEGGENVGG